MAKATIEIDDQFTFTWDKTTAGSEAQKRRIPQFVKEFFEKNIRQILKWIRYFWLN